ncbi:MAG: hypothetical protein AB7F88_19765 [Pyrinomonadaceae bacterium]
MEATKQAQEYTEFDPGAEESSSVHRIFVNLRAGKIGQTSDKPIEGYREFTNVNKAGQEFKFYAKTYDHLTGFVDDIRWHTHKLQDGTVLSGWNITIDTGAQGTFVLGVSTKDRPFQQLMNCLVNVDFGRTVRFVGFWGKNQFNDRPQKVLLLSQGLDPATKKPIWVQPAHEQKWLSRLLIQKLKEGVPLTEQEERNVSRMHDGKFNKEYPYIVQNADESWSFDTWNNFLHEQMDELVIPACKFAYDERANGSRLESAAGIDESDLPDFAGPTPAAPASDDDIPF